MQTRKKAVPKVERAGASVEEVREQVRTMIQNGELRPGEHINEQALALQLRVGRAMAREALRSLEQAGLVRIIPNRGAEVCKLALEDALHLYDIRAGLARSSGRLITSRITAEDEKLLLSTLDEMDEAANQRDAVRYHELNEVFHQFLMQATKNPRLVALNAVVEDELRLYLHKGVFTLAQIRISMAEHREILTAIMNGESERAARAFEAHILTGKQRMLDTIGAQTRDARSSDSSDTSGSQRDYYG